MLTTCIMCKKPHNRIKIKTYANRQSMYHDDAGNAWKGKHCPICAAEQHKIYQRKRRRKLKMKSRQEPIDT